MSYEILISQDFFKALKKLSKSIKKEILDVLEEIAEDPYRFKRLRYNLKGFFSARVGKFRIIYRVNEDEKCVEIYAFEHRKKVYR